MANLMRSSEGISRHQWSSVVLSGPHGERRFRPECDVPLADEEGDQDALGGLSDAPLAGACGGAGRALCVRLGGVKRLCA